MPFIKRNENKKDIPDLKPFAEADDVAKKFIPGKIFGRVQKLRRLRMRPGEESPMDKTIRLGDKRSAASLSLLFPGLGQVYMGQRAFGLTFMISNLAIFAVYLFLSGILRISVFSNSLVPSYDFHVLLIAPLAIAVLSGISIHMAFDLFPELKLAQLISANRKNRLYWLSYFFPGYGQLLNGQPKKSAVFCSLWLLGIFSAASIFFAYSINWYEYTEELGINFVEKSLLILAAFVVIGFASYFVGIFDTFVVRNNPYLKRPVSKRIKRFLGMQGSSRDRTPHRRTSLKFVLVSLALFSILLVRMARPSYRTFYGEYLNKATVTLDAKGMKFVPGLLKRIHVPIKIQRLERALSDLIS